MVEEGGKFVVDYYFMSSSSMGQTKFDRLKESSR